jgi:hypothetical protein
MGKQETDNIGKQDTDNMGKQDTDNMRKQDTDNMGKQDTDNMGKQDTDNMDKQDTGRRQTNHSTTENTKKMSNTDPTKDQRFMMLRVILTLKSASYLDIHINMEFGNDRRCIAKLRHT